VFESRERSVCVNWTAAGAGRGDDVIDVEATDGGVALYGRGRFLGVLALAGASVVGADWIGVADAASPRPSAAQDRAIFNFALVLEDLLSGFYAAALARGGLSGELKRFAEVAGEHERDHASFIRQALGSHARPKASFRFGALTRSRAKFVPAAIELEDLAVAAYNGQAANLTRPALGHAIRIVSVEGKHAAWIRAIAHDEPAPRAADPGVDVAAVTAALRRLHVR
jgi:hypothetical protein